MTPEQRKRAGKAVAARIKEMASSPSKVARAAGVDPKTVRALIDGSHWPQDATQSAIEAVLRWPEGAIVTRAVQGGVDGVLSTMTDVELATELLRRLNLRQQMEAKLSRQSEQNGGSPLRKLFPKQREDSA